MQTGDGQFGRAGHERADLAGQQLKAHDEAVHVLDVVPGIALVQLRQPVAEGERHLDRARHAQKKPWIGAVGVRAFLIDGDTVVAQRAPLEQRQKRRAVRRAVQRRLEALKAASGDDERVLLGDYGGVPVGERIGARAAVLRLDKAAQREGGHVLGHIDGEGIERIKAGHHIDGIVGALVHNGAAGERHGQRKRQTQRHKQAFFHSEYPFREKLFHSLL